MLNAFDEKVFQFFHGFAGSSGILDIIFEFCAEYLIYFLLAAFLIFLIKEKQWKKRLYFGVASLLSVIISRGLITEIIKHYYLKARPFETLGFDPLIMEYSPAFPSGHASLIFAIVPFAFLINKTFGYWFTALSIIVSISRIIVGVHWPSDILGGAILGVIIALIVGRLAPKVGES